jgi:hypothetical protein
LLKGKRHLVSTVNSLDKTRGHLLGLHTRRNPVFPMIVHSVRALGQGQKSGSNHLLNEILTLTGKRSQSLTISKSLVTVIS